MNTLRRIPAVFEFEWRRTLTAPRIAWMLVLALLPPVILLTVRMSATMPLPHEVNAVLVYVLCPCMACVLSVFLNAAPAVASELEGRSWVYISVRPYGPTAVLLGKYLVAISWAIPVGIVSSVLGVYALRDDQASELIPVECSLAVLSCISYAALYLLLGVISPKRAMVLGITYTLLVEAALASVPAVVNTLTIQYRLRCLLVKWADIKVPDRDVSKAFELYFGDMTPKYHVAIILLMTVFFLVASTVLLRFREFTSAAETDT